MAKARKKKNVLTQAAYLSHRISAIAQELGLQQDEDVLKLLDSIVEAKKHGKSVYVLGAESVSYRTYNKGEKLL